MTKYRIKIEYLKNGETKYQVQSKKSFFDGWGDLYPIASIKSIDDGYWYIKELQGEEISKTEYVSY